MFIEIHMIELAKRDMLFFIFLVLLCDLLSLYASSQQHSPQQNNNESDLPFNVLIIGGQCFTQMVILNLSLETNEPNNMGTHEVALVNCQQFGMDEHGVAGPTETGRRRTYPPSASFHFSSL